MDVSEHNPQPKAKRVAKLFSTAFALVKIGTRFQYRSVQAVKTSNREAVLIPSGKFIRVEPMKMVKVRG
jgi:hypothetical protein